MYNEKIFNKFCKERHIKESTRKGYQSAIQHYVKVQKHSLEYLIDEALHEEEEKIPLKDRKLKKRLISYRNFLFDSKMSHNTLKTYIQKIKTVYNHFEVTIPNLPQAKYDIDYEINFMTNPEDLKQEYIEHLAVLTMGKDIEKVTIKSPEYQKLEETNKKLQKTVDTQQETYNNLIARIEALENKSDEDILNKFPKKED